MATKLNETMEFICNCLVFNDEYIDKLFTDFDVDMDESDVYAALDVCHDNHDYRMFGNLIIRRVFEIVQETYVEKGLNEDLFTWSINNQGSELCYDGKEIKRKSQLDAIIRERKERDPDCFGAVGPVRVKVGEAKDPAVVHLHLVGWPGVQR